MAYYGKQKRGRPMKPENAYLQAVQGIYKAYCFHVHNVAYANNEKAEWKDLKWKPSKFHKDLCDRVQEFLEKPTDKAYEIMIISTPPQHGKSTTITETLPSWFLMRNPECNVIQVSYGDSLAERFGKRNKEKIAEFGSIFGVELDPSKKSSKNFMLNGHKGGMISAGVGGGLTGNPAHLMVIDDPVKNRQEADSQRSRDSLWDEFEHSMTTRLAAGAKVILIMTRWHEDDLAGRILENMGDITTYVNYECECESEDDPLGRKIGEPLCPEIGKDEKWLKSYKQSFTNESGMRAWEALFQGHPTIQEGNILKKEWWKYYEPKEGMKFDQMIMSVDAAFKDGERNDYVAISIWGKRENKIFLVHMVNEHLNLAATIRKITLLKLHYPRVSAIYIEDAANGRAIIETLSREVMGVIPVPPDKSKEARVNAISVFIEAGNVYLPEGDPMTYKFVEQCAKFPNDKHDDMVDSMSQALYKLAYSRKGRVLSAFKKKSDWILPHERPKKRVDVGGLIRPI